MDTLKLAIVGHVDHGKSTLVGRLLHETDALPEGKVRSVQAMSEKRGMPFEWAFVIDAMQAERDQGITIDTTQIRFKSDKRNYVLIDAPGHRQFLKNMVSGAASADAVVLVVDAHEGVQDQTRRHAYLLRLLGIPQVVVAVNKMDLAGYRESRFDEVKQEVADYLRSIEVKNFSFVPVAAREGANLKIRGAEMAWYDGPTLLEALDALPQPVPAADLPLRLWVQDVYKFDERRIVAGRIESGRLRVGDTLLFSPSNASARVASIESWNTPAPAEAQAGCSVGFTLDEDIFVERGQVASHPERAPTATNAFRARVFWLGRRPLAAGAQYRLRHGCAETLAVIERVESVIDTNTLEAAAAERVAGGAIAEVIVRLRGLLAVDDRAQHPVTGRFVLVDGHQIVGGGTVSTGGFAAQPQSAAPKSANLFHTEHRVLPVDRARMNGHRGGILWFTGLSGAGKSTLAVELERLLFRKGRQVYLLDGDNVRHGLNKDLGFSPQDRTENIRRVGEVAALMAEAGMIVISAFISPYRLDRDRLRAAHPEVFHEVYINASLEVCESRDVKGLYKRARAGQIPEFTGISAPYEPPIAPELEIRSGEWPVARCIAELALYVQKSFVAPALERAATAPSGKRAVQAVQA
jgi:bifunctional enzyme CysN/CysC